MKAISKSSVYAGDVWITKTIPKYTLSESQFSIDFKPTLSHCVHLIQEIKTTKNPSFCWPQFLKQKQQQKVARLAVQLIPPHSETKTFKKLQLKWPGGVKLDTPLSALVTLTAQVMCFHITIHCCYWNNLRARKISGEVATAYNEYPREVNS